MADCDLGVAGGDHVEDARVLEAARDVVDDPHAGGDRALRDLGAVGVDAHDGAVGCERLDHGEHASQLLFSAPTGWAPGSGRLSADVEHGRALLAQLAPVRDRGASCEKNSPPSLNESGVTFTDSPDLPSALSPFPYHQRDDLRPGGRGSQLAARGDRDGGAVGLLPSAHRHALVHRVEHDDDAAGGEGLRDRVGDLLAEVAPAPAGRLARMSMTLVNAPSPTTFFSPGRYATCAVPWLGSRWCSHTERNRMPRTITAPDGCVSGAGPEATLMVEASGAAGSCHRPPNISATISATRSGVRVRPGRSGVLADGDQQFARELGDPVAVHALRTCHGSGRGGTGVAGLLGSRLRLTGRCLRLGRVGRHRQLLAGAARHVDRRQI